ncbi:hypothetical protein Ddye_021857 [Dipteronia dyeriana]|uniref:Uncharacterized protein n=1 Tax=Dipteronia dyeriana TaxID=168575 RepID=A0AAD9U2Z5_9ROSI|nr:hypothetical protein Ddye_021857 [Dipteronia dyeriana]
MDSEVSYETASDDSSCIFGFVLFLQLFYLHSLRWETPLVDKALIPVVCWSNVKTKKCLIWLHDECGVGSNQILVEDIYNQPSAPGGQYDAVSHGCTSHANQDPSTNNNEHIKGIDNVLHVVKEMQATLKSELNEIRTKIINLIPEYKTINSKSKRSQLYWFLPTNYAFTALTCTDGNQLSLKKSLSRLRKSYMYDLRRCKKMEPLDIVLGDDIFVAFPATFSFVTFNISSVKVPS